MRSEKRGKEGEETWQAGGEVESERRGEKDRDKEGRAGPEMFLSWEVFYTIIL